MTQSQAVLSEAPGLEETETSGHGAGMDFTDPNSPLAPYYLQTSHLLALALLGAIFLFFNSLPLWHTDVWGHLKFGQWIVQHGRLPECEPFCPFADPEPTSLHYAWLSQSVLYVIFHGGELLAGGDAARQLEGGVEMLRIAHALVALLRGAVLLLAFRRLTGSLPLACGGFVVMMLLSAGHFSVLRPQVFAELLFAFLLLSLSRPLLSRTALVALPILMTLWANLHGSYLVGLAVLTAWLVGRVVEMGHQGLRFCPRRAWADGQVRRLLLALVLSVAAMSVFNPHGPGLFQQTLALAHHPNIATMEEWKPLDFSARWGGHWAYLAALGLLVAIQFLSPRWFTPAQWLVLFGIGVPACMQQRVMVWWVTLVPWLALPLWSATGSLLRWPWLHWQSVPSFRKTLLAGMLVLLVVLWSIPAGWLLSGRPHPLEKSIGTGTPWQLAAQLQAPADAPVPWLPSLAWELRQHYPDGRFRGGLFASESLGDYLLWALPPEMPVAVYTHVHLFTPEYWNDCLKVRSGLSGWNDILDKQRVNLIVVESEMHPQLRVAIRRDPAWKIILDEKGDPAKRDERCRLLIALRTEPL